MSKTYAVEIMGQEKVTYVNQVDVAKIVEGASRGAKLVVVGQSIINPASVSRIRRAWNVDPSEIDRNDEELTELIRNVFREPQKLLSPEEVKELERT